MLKKDDFLINKQLSSNKFNSKIIKVDTKNTNKFLKNVNNEYFLTETNKENFIYLFRNIKILKIKKIC